MSLETGRPGTPVAGSGRITGHPHSHNLSAVLRQRGFRRLLGVRLTAQVSDGMFQAGLAGSVLFNPQSGASPMAIAAAFAIVLLPYSVIGPYIGVLLDRWSRRTVMVLSNLARAALLLPIAGLIWTGSQGPLFMVLSLIAIGLGRLFVAAVSAAIPHVVADRRLTTANAAVNTLGSVGYAIGLGVIALLVLLGLPATFHGYAVAASAAPVGYLAAGLLARWSYNQTELGPDISTHEPVPFLRAIASVGSQTADGFRHIARRKAAAYPLIAQSAHRVMYGALALAITLRYRSVLTDEGDLASSISGMGGAFVAGSIGTLIAAFITPAITRRIGGWHWIIGLFGVTGVVVAVFGTRENPALLPIAIGWVGVAAQGTKIVVDTALQHECHDDFRGRAFSINDTLFNLCFVLGTYAGAMTMPHTGNAPAVMIIIAAAYLAGAAWLYAVRTNGAASETAATADADADVTADADTAMAMATTTTTPRATKTIVPVARTASYHPRLSATAHESRWASAR
ncbi:MAG: MFS transporter [Micromonosporaceae bacterium]|nr:MFS transporter [Micromonosporaceae bacterium]